jgi:hypothetical protein
MKTSVIQALENAKNAKAFPASGSLVKINDSLINIRTATQKSGSKYWFDVTPSFYTKVQFFLFACGNASTVYVFPSTVLQAQLKNASLGGQKQVPNFTIFSDKHELEPAGASEMRNSIRQYLNAYSLIP